MRNSDMPAMPCQGSIDYDNNEPLPYQFGNNSFIFPGMSKREYFAALAMQGLTSSPLESEKLSHAANKSLKMFVVEQAVAIADALLEELEKDMT